MSEFSTRLAAARQRRFTGRRLLAVGAVVVAAVGTGFAGYAAAGQTTVTLTAAGPQPASVTVGVGDTVVFTNADNENHSIVAAGMFTSPVILPGQTFSVALPTLGSVKYAQTGFHKSTHGAIAVNVVGTVDLHAERLTVVAGSPLVLSGRSPLPGAVVTLSQRVAGQHWADVSVLPTSSDGTFQTTVQPLSGTSYRVTAASGKVTSAAVSIVVVPLLTIHAVPLRVRTGRLVKVTGLISPPSSATTAELMAYNRAGGVWKRVVRHPVAASGRVTFSWPAAAGTTLLRLSVAKHDLRPGLKPTTSAHVTVKGIGAAPQTHKPAKQKH